MIQFVLTGAGYVVIDVATREDALKKLNAQHFDLILADLNTLNSGGLSFICDVHSMPQYINTPIIVLTAEMRFFNKALYNNCGVINWLTKPYQPDKLVGIINDALSGVK